MKTLVIIIALALSGCASLTNYWIKCVVLRLSSLVNICGILWAGMSSKVYERVVYADARLPFLPSLIKSNASIAGSIPRNNGEILQVFCLRGLTKIVNSVIHRVPVNVVNLILWPFSSAMQPSQSMGSVMPAPKFNTPVACRPFAPGNTSDFCAATRLNEPVKHPGFTVVTKSFTDKLSVYLANNFFKVVDLIGVFVAVNVKYLGFRECSVNKQPCEHMRPVLYPAYTYNPVTLRADATRDTLVAVAALSAKNSSFRVVVKNFVQALCGKIGLSHDTVPSLIGQRPGRVISTSRLRYFIIGLLPIAMLTGCATGNTEYYKSVDALSASNAASEIARYNALSKLAEGGDPASKAIAAIALGNFGGQAKQAIQIAPPRNGWDTFVAVSQVWAAPLVNAYGIGKNAAVAVTQSNNATALGMSTNNAFLGMAGQIQAPGAITTTTLSGTGNLGSGTYGTTDRNDVTNTSPVITPVVQVAPTVITPVVQVVPVVQGVQ